MIISSFFWFTAFGRLKSLDYEETVGFTGWPWVDWQDPAEQSWHQQWSEENEVQDDQYPVGDVA